MILNLFLSMMTKADAMSLTERKNAYADAKHMGRISLYIRSFVFL